MVHTSTGLPTYLTGIRCQEARRLTSRHRTLVKGNMCSLMKWHEVQCCKECTRLRVRPATNSLCNLGPITALCWASISQLQNGKVDRGQCCFIATLQVDVRCLRLFLMRVRGRLDQWPLGPLLPLLTEQLCLRHWIMCLNKGLLQKTGNC